jgi:hypothetical protein
VKATFLLLLFYGNAGVLAVPYPSIGACMIEAPQRLGTEIEKWDGTGERPKVLFAICAFGIGSQQPSEPEPP